jgi:uncharacterized membrane protein
MSELPPPAVDYESAPLSRQEYIAAVVHLYRGELYRANSWRIRLDNTTNWAVLTAAGLLTFTFGEGSHSHWVLLLGLALVAAFHTFEARRFRTWHVWRSRVRMIEENFYGPILRRDLRSPDVAWGVLVARDLFQPRYKIGRLQALRARLVRNYWAVYAVILGAWVIKVSILTEADGKQVGFPERLSGGNLSWWFAALYLSVFLAGICVLLFLPSRVVESEVDYWLPDAQAGKESMPMDL